jgi:hypothetical protein
MVLYRNPSDPRYDLLRGGNAAKGGSVRTILYVSGALVTVVVIAVTMVAAVNH